MITTDLKKDETIFWKGIKCKFIKWDSLNFGGKIKIRINNRTIEVDISELHN